MRRRGVHLAKATHRLALVSTGVVQNEQIEADVEQLMDLMKTRKQQLESLLNEKMRDFGLVCVLENVRENDDELTLILRSVLVAAINRCNVGRTCGYKRQQHSARVKISRCR